MATQTREPQAMRTRLNLTELAKAAGTNYNTGRWYTTRIAALKPSEAPVRGAKNGGSRVFTPAQCFKLALCLELSTVGGGDTVARARRMLRAVGLERTGWALVSAERAEFVSEGGFADAPLDGPYSVIDVGRVSTETEGRLAIALMDRLPDANFGQVVLRSTSEVGS